MYNKALKNITKELLKDKTNIESITKGDVGGASIEIVNKEPPSYDSYLYKDKITERDSDFNLLTELIPNK
jgi:Ni,Fe-hydrogenase III small subunit